MQLVFTPEKSAAEIELQGIRKGDVGCTLILGVLEPGNIDFVADYYGSHHRYGRKRSGEAYGGRCLIVMTHPFDYDAGKIVAHRHPPVIVKAKCSVLTRAALKTTCHI